MDEERKRFEAWAKGNGIYAFNVGSIGNIPDMPKIAWLIWQAALPAQPSSGSHGERATQEMVDAGAAALLAYRKSGGDYTVHPTHAAEAAINAALSVRRCCDSDRCAGHSALSAQPSPGGQGDAPVIELRARELLAEKYRRAGHPCEAEKIIEGYWDNHPSIQAINAALADRQPVVEP